MQIYFIIVKDISKYKIKELEKNYYFTTFNGNKIIVPCYPEDFKIAYAFNSYNIVENNKILLKYQPVDITVDSIVISDQLYLKYNKYCINENKFIDKNNLFLYNEILKKDKNLIEIDIKILIDLLNKYAQNDNSKIFILKLKHKYYLHLVTPNYYYIIRFKNNNFKLIKKFKYWYNFAIDEKYNLYCINNIIQIYEIHKSFIRYKEFINIVNNNYFESNKFIYFNNRRRNIVYKDYIKYAITYRKNKLKIKEIIINFNSEMFINLIISKRIYFERKFKFYFHIPFVI